LTANLYKELKRRLSLGLFLDNLDPAITLTEEASWQSANPLGLFVLGRILRLIANEWDPLDEQRGIPRSQLDRMHAQLSPALVSYLDGAIQGWNGPENEWHGLNELVRAFLAWSASRP
jgi:hypothetical protein